MIPLTDEHLEALMSHPRSVVYKHSPSCWLSALAARRLAGVGDRHPALPVYVIDVLEQRDLSQALAQRLDVPHASPQLILLQSGRAAWDTSHMGVTAGALDRALADLDQGKSSAGQAPSSDQRSSRS